MKILIGTTNPAKAAVFAKQLGDYPVELLTLTDLGIKKHPDEDGKNPMENDGEYLRRLLFCREKKILCDRSCRLALLSPPPLGG